MLSTRILLMLTVFFALTYTAGAYMEVIPGEPVTLTGPSPTQSGISYHYQWTAYANGVNINNLLFYHGLPANTSQQILRFDAPWFSSSTDITISLWMCSTKQGGSQLDGCVDTANAETIHVLSYSCVYVSGYIGDKCSANTTADTYAYLRNPSGLTLNWYIDDSTTPYDSGPSTSILWSSHGLGAHTLTLKAWQSQDPISQDPRWSCVKNVFVVGVPDASIAIT